MSAVPSELPLYAKDDVREATPRPSTRTSTFSSSSEMPSEKYSLSLSPLMLTKGSTAIEVPADFASAAGCAAVVEGPAAAVAAGAATGICPTHQNSPPPINSSAVRIANSRPLTRWCPRSP